VVGQSPSITKALSLSGHPPSEYNSWDSPNVVVTGAGIEATARDEARSSAGGDELLRYDGVSRCHLPGARGAASAGLFSPFALATHMPVRRPAMHAAVPTVPLCMVRDGAGLLAEPSPAAPVGTLHALVAEDKVSPRAVAITCWVFSAAAGA
jgi:hypothetical protein